MEAQLDARAGSFLSLDENELMLVRDNHVRPAVTRRTLVALDREGTLIQRHPGKQDEAWRTRLPLESVVEGSDLARIPAPDNVPGSRRVVIAPGPLASVPAFGPGQIDRLVDAELLENEVDRRPGSRSGKQVGGNLADRVGVKLLDILGEVASG
jgi:hypothetical protein